PAHSLTCSYATSVQGYEDHLRMVGRNSVSACVLAYRYTLSFTSTDQLGSLPLHTLHKEQITAGQSYCRVSVSTRYVLPAQPCTALHSPAQHPCTATGRAHGGAPAHTPESVT